MAKIPEMNWHSNKLAEALEIFKKEMEYCIEDENITSPEKKAVKILRGLGTEGVKQLEASRLSETDRRDPKKLWDFFETQLKIADFREHRLQLTNMKQLENETLDEFCTRARTKALSCQFEQNELVERMIVLLIIASTPIEAFRRKLLSKEKGCSLSLEETLAVGRRFENKTDPEGKSITPEPLTEFKDGAGDSGVSGSDSFGSSAVKCHCGEDAVYLTVTKETPNKSRPFYKCPRPKGRQCKFFLWADELEGTSDGVVNTSSSTSRVRHSLRVPPSSGGGIVQCNCELRAKRWTVTKKGPNTGKMFYTCPKPQGETSRCNFYQWTDDVQGSTSKFSKAGGSTSNSCAGQGGRGKEGAGQKRKANDSNNTTTKKPKRCSVCRTEGHTKKKCPYKLHK